MPGLGIIEAIFFVLGLIFLLVLGIIGLFKRIHVLFREIFSRYLTDPFPFTYDGGEHVVTALLTKPIRLHRKKEFVLILLGDLTEDDIPQIEQDLVAGISTSYYKLLQRCTRDIDEVLEFTYINYQPLSQEVFYYGLMLGEFISVYDNNIRFDTTSGIGYYFKKGVKLKGLKWVFIASITNTLTEWGLPCVKEKKYKQSGKIIIKFRFKKKKANYIIPIELVKIWKNVKWSSDSRSKALTLQLNQIAERFQLNPADLSDYDNVPVGLIFPYRASIINSSREPELIGEVEKRILKYTKVPELVRKVKKEILKYRRENFKNFKLYPPLKSKK